MHVGNRMSILLLLHGKGKARESDKVPLYVLCVCVCSAQQYNGI